jgi:hypothetical protein
MGKFIKVILQIIVFYSPIIYWNLNSDKLSVKEGLIFIGCGLIVALLIEWTYGFISYCKN